VNLKYYPCLFETRSHLDLLFFDYYFVYDFLGFEFFLNMISTTVFTLLFLHYVNAQNGAWVPEPLPAITPPDVVNLLIQDAADGAGDFVASVVGAVRHLSSPSNGNANKYRTQLQQHTL